MSEQTCKNTTTNNLHCFGGDDDSACDESGIVGVLKSGSGVAGLQLRLLVYLRTVRIIQLNTKV